MLPKLHEIAPTRLRRSSRIRSRPRAQALPWARHAEFAPLPRYDAATQRRAWLLVLFVVSFFFFSELFSF